MLSKTIIAAAAGILKIENRAVEAVALTECSKNAFLATGEPTILFEPHVFWRQLVERGIDPAQYCKTTITAKRPGTELPITMPADSPILPILYPKWVRGYYGKTSQQHEKLGRARAIHDEAALCSASWGMFQIMGYHWKACGCRSIDEFIDMMWAGEDNHLHLFVHFLLSHGYHRHLRLKPGKKALEMDQIEAFCAAYNGAGYRANDYHNVFYRHYIKLPAL